MTREIIAHSIPCYLPFTIKVLTECKKRENNFVKMEIDENTISG
jgi:hypothetical protein